MTDYLIPITVGYVLGSVPFGLIAAWAFKRVDIRDFGSGRTGMTNVLRTVGAPAAAIVLVLDMGKGLAAVMVARLLGDSHGAEVTAALAAMVGHNWPVFIGFKGGRGTAPRMGWALHTVAPRRPDSAGSGFSDCGSHPIRLTGLTRGCRRRRGRTRCHGRHRPRAFRVHVVRRYRRSAHRSSAQGQHPAPAQRRGA